MAMTIPIDSTIPNSQPLRTMIATTQAMIKDMQNIAINVRIKSLVAINMIIDAKIKEMINPFFAEL